MSKFKNQDIIVGQTKIDIQTLNKARDVIRAINNPVRKEIIRIIGEKKQIDVHSIRIATKLKDQPTTSQHLAILRKSNIIQAKTEGKRRVYSLDEKTIKYAGQLINDLSLIIK